MSIDLQNEIEKLENFTMQVLWGGVSRWVRSTYMPRYVLSSDEFARSKRILNKCVDNYFNEVERVLKVRQERGSIIIDGPDICNDRRHKSRL